MQTNRERNTMKELALRRLIDHQNYSESDLNYLTAKGYTHDEILRMWDSEKERRQHSVMHTPPSDLLGFFDTKTFRGKGT